MAWGALIAGMRLMGRRLRFLLVVVFSLGNGAFAQTYVITPQAPAANVPILISATWPNGGNYVHTQTYVITGNSVSVRFVQDSERNDSVSIIQSHIVVPPLPLGTYTFSIDWDPGPEWKGPSVATQSFTVVVGQARVVGDPIVLTQSTDRHVAAHVTGYLSEGCLSSPTGLYPGPSTPSVLDLITNVECPPPATPVLYTSTVDLGVLADGDFEVVWSFVAGGFGPVGSVYILPFSVKDGLLVGRVDHAPVTPVCVDPNGCLQISPNAPASNQKIDIAIQPVIPSDAIIPYFNVSVANGTVKIDGAYRPRCRNCSPPEPPPSQPMHVVLEPLAPGHYTLQFSASADPSYGSDGYINGPDGLVQAPIVIAGSFDVAPSATPLNYGGLWWAAPARSEAGWGINFAHQGDVIFASWFTYDLAGKAVWLVMSATKTGATTYGGQLFQASGPAYDAVPFPPLGSPGGAVGVQVGVGSLTFNDAGSGTFTYTVNGLSQTKAITREIFGPLPNCTFGVETNLALASNYQDLWWAAPAGSQAGWGINLTHQGDTIFATWFTFDHDHTPMWVAMAAAKTGFGSYIGQLYRTSGPPFNSVPFSPIGAAGGASGSIVGNGGLFFTDGNSGTFYYTLNGAGGVKQITREVFTSPGTVCQ